MGGVFQTSAFGMRNKLHLVAIVLILAIGIFLRTYHLTDIPGPLNIDEISYGFDAWSLLTTGVDRYGVRWPILFRSLGAFTQPIITYSTIPFVWLLGPTPIAVRLPPVLFGSASVVLMYFVGKRFFSKKIGLISAVLLAISPWHIQLSRAGLQPATVTFFVLLGLLCFKWAFDARSKKSIWYWIIAGAACGLWWYTYHAMYAITLPFIFILGIWAWRERPDEKKNILLGGVSFFAVSLPFVFSFLHNVQGVLLYIQQNISVFYLGTPKGLLMFSKQLLLLLLPQSYIFSGPYTGHYFVLLNFLEYIFLIIGVVCAICSRVRAVRSIVFFFFLAILAASSTLESLDSSFQFNPIRYSPLIIPLYFLIALGSTFFFDFIFSFFRNIRAMRVFIASIVVGIFFIQTVIFGYYYFIRWPKISIWTYFSKIDELVSYLPEPEQSDTRVYVLEPKSNVFKVNQFLTYSMWYKGITPLRWHSLEKAYEPFTFALYKLVRLGSWYQRPLESIEDIISPAVVVSREEVSFLPNPVIIRSPASHVPVYYVYTVGVSR